MENQVNAMPRIGDLAPEFQAVTTQGKINFPNDFSGNGKFCSAILLTLHRFAHRSS